MDSSAPPPIRQAPSSTGPAWHPALDSPVMIDRRVATGTEGLTLGEVREDILKGGRFVIYTWVISVLVMTFRRSSGIHFIRSGRDGAGRAMGYSLLSLLLGPWGFPWGLIWTPGCIFTNLAGGKDVTQPMLDALLGSEESANVIFKRKKHHAGWSMIMVRTIFISAPIALFANFILGEQESRAAETRATKAPGYAQFQHANNAASGSKANGNTSDARDAATRLAQGMKEFLDEGTKDVTPSLRASHACGVWCEINGDRCIVLVRVPDLQHYNADAKTTLANGAWMGSLACLKGVPSVKPGSALYVAVRGEGPYESVMTGRLSDNVDSKPTGKYGSNTGRAKLIEGFNPEGGENPE